VRPIAGRHTISRIRDSDQTARDVPRHQHRENERAQHDARTEAACDPDIVTLPLVNQFGGETEIQMPGASLAGFDVGDGDHVAFAGREIRVSGTPLLRMKTAPFDEFAIVRVDRDAIHLRIVRIPCE